MTTPRTTKQDLQFRVDHLNKLTGRTFYLQGAYGGWQLMENLGNGSQGVTPGFVSKRQLQERLDCIITGFLMGAKAEKERKRREEEHPYAYN